MVLRYDENVEDSGVYRTVKLIFPLSSTRVTLLKSPPPYYGFVHTICYRPVVDAYTIESFVFPTDLIGFISSRVP